MLAWRVKEQSACLEVCVARLSEKEGVSRQGVVLGRGQHRVVAEVIGDEHPTPFSVQLYRASHWAPPALEPHASDQ
ncbi:hypothetical protein D3C73_719770 [compost metagenome]